MPQAVFSLMLRDSSWAKQLKSVSSSSPEACPVMAAHPENKVPLLRRRGNEREFTETQDGQSGKNALPSRADFDKSIP